MFKRNILWNANISTSTGNKNKWQTNEIREDESEVSKKPKAHSQPDCQKSTIESALPTEMENLPGQGAQVCNIKKTYLPCFFCCCPGHISLTEEIRKQLILNFLIYNRTPNIALQNNVELGKFYVLALCRIAHVQKDQNSFSTIGHWKEHEASWTHQQGVTQEK